MSEIKNYYYYYYYYNLGRSPSYLISVDAKYCSD